MSDDNDKSMRFPPLNDSNYSEWSMRMEAEFVRKGLWDMVFCEVVGEGKTLEQIAEEVERLKAKRNAKKMAEARAEMVMRAERGQLVHMRDRDPMIIWESLAKVHRARGLATRLVLRRMFTRVVKEDSESMQAYIGRVQDLAFELESIGVNVTSEDRILSLTSGLDESYDAFVISLDSTPEELLTVDLVVTRMLNEEARRIGREMGNSPYQEVKGFAATVPAKRNPGLMKTRGRTCYRCGKEGHIRRFCKEVIGGKTAAATVAQVVADGAEGP